MCCITAAARALLAPSPVPLVPLPANSPGISHHGHSELEARARRAAAGSLPAPGRSVQARIKPQVATSNKPAASTYPRFVHDQDTAGHVTVDTTLAHTLLPHALMVAVPTMETPDRHLKRKMGSGQRDGMKGAT